MIMGQNVSNSAAGWFFHSLTLNRHSLYMNGQFGGNAQRSQFDQLCRSLRPDLVRFAFWLARDRAVAEDVVQETLLRAWKARNTLVNSAAVKGWLLTIVRREFARSFERKRLPTVDLHELIAREEPALAGDSEPELLDLRKALLELADEYREPLVMQTLFGFSTEDIARELGLTRGAVLTRLFRARQQLRIALGEGAPGDPPYEGDVSVEA